MRSEASLEVVRTIPLGRLMLETDAPWCSIKNTHPGKPFVVTEWATKDKKKAFRNLEEACASGDEASRLAEEARMRQGREAQRLNAARQQLQAAQPVEMALFSC